MATKYQYIVDLVLNSKEFQKGIADHVRQVKQAESAQMKVRDALKKVAGTVGIAFSTAALIKFGAESVALAARAEGVRAAFNKINDPQLLGNLRKATRGAVSDLNLMTAAVQAKNFKISLEAFPKYLEFASQRALETGQGIDYMVESIVTGVGRKSVLILDNLGLSVTEINEELQRTPDFAEAVGNVMARNMKEAGDVASTTATQLQQMNASWQNFKETIGSSFLASAGGSALDAASVVIEVWGDKALTFGQKLKAMTAQGALEYKANKDAVIEYFATLSKEGAEWELQRQTGADKDSKWKRGLAEARLAEIKAIEEANNKQKEKARTLEDVNADLQLHKDLLLKTAVADKAGIEFHVQKIKLYEAEKKAVEDLLKVKEKEKPHDLEALMSGTRYAALPDGGKMDLIGKKDTDKGLLSAFGIDPTQLEGMNEILERSKDNIDKNAEAWKKYAEVVSEKKEALNGMFSDTASILSSIAGVTDEGTAGWLNFAAKTLETIPTLITQVAALQAELAGQAISGAVAGANTLTFPFNIIAMGVSIAATLAALATSVPKFAEGGIISGPTLGMMGEYPGAKSDPEIVAPLSKLSKMMQPALTEGEVVFRIGEDALFGQLRRYEKKRANIR